jgi:hypothetical protein
MRDGTAAEEVVGTKLLNFQREIELNSETKNCRGLF